MELFNSCSQRELEMYYELIDKFNVQPGNITNVRSNDSGRINKTIMLVMNHEGVGFRKYVLQKINVNVFKDPAALMNNINQVTDFLRDQGEITLHTYKVKKPVVSDSVYYDEEQKEYWRLYDFIDADVKDAVETAHDMYVLGDAIGDFSRALANFDATKLVETIPDFHNTAKRYSKFISTISDSDNSRREAGYNEKGDKLDFANPCCYKDIDFICERKDIVGEIVYALREGKIPVRVSHNDPKLNNVLFHKYTGKVLCFVDLDTVMPGSILYDFGDAVRFCCNTASEEETNIEMVHFNVPYFKEFTEGFLKSMKDVITEEEVKLLVDSALLMTLELAIRFLDDHVAGNKYFGVPYDGKNLERARVQIALVKAIEEKRAELEAIVSDLWNKLKA